MKRCRAKSAKSYKLGAFPFANSQRFPRKPADHHASDPGHSSGPPRPLHLQLGAARQLARPCEDLFESIDSCLNDAGEALATYFERVQIFYGGIPLGTHPVAQLMHDPLGLLEEMRRRLTAVYRVRAAHLGAGADRSARREREGKGPEAQDGRARAAPHFVAPPAAAGSRRHGCRGGDRLLRPCVARDGQNPASRQDARSRR